MNQHTHSNDHTSVVPGKKQVKSLNWQRGWPIFAIYPLPASYFTQYSKNETLTMKNTHGKTREYHLRASVEAVFFTFLSSVHPSPLVHELHVRRLKDTILFKEPILQHKYYIRQLQNTRIYPLTHPSVFISNCPPNVGLRTPKVLTQQFCCVQKAEKSLVKSYILLPL